MHIAAFLENIAVGAAAEGIPIKEALERMMDAGMEKLYLMPQSIERCGGEEFIATLEELHLPVEGMHCFFDFGHHPEDESYRDFIDTAARLGAGNVLIVPGFIPKENEDQRDEMLENMKNVLIKAVAYGKEKGVAVSMEDFDGLMAPFCTVDGLDWFMQNVDGLQCSFDTGNFVMYHEDEVEAFRRFRDKICTMHVKDRGTVKLHENDRQTVCADGAEFYPIAVGSGVIKVAEIIGLLKEQGYEGGLIAEIFNCDGAYMLDSIAQSIKWIKSQIV